MAMPQEIRVSFSRGTVLEAQSPVCVSVCVCCACFAAEQSRVNISRGCLEHQSCLLSPLPIKTQTERVLLFLCSFAFSLGWALLAAVSLSVTSHLIPSPAALSLWNWFFSPLWAGAVRSEHFSELCAVVAVGCILHAAAGCLYSPLEGRGSRRHSGIVAGSILFFFLHTQIHFWCFWQVFCMNVYG